MRHPNGTKTQSSKTAPVALERAFDIAVILERKKKRALRQNTKPLLLIALPGILYLLINNYLPMIGIFLAFKDYSLCRHGDHPFR